MQTEVVLLLDIIALAPNGSIWSISKDSWKEIPNLSIAKYLVTGEHEWQLVINDLNRGDISAVIEKYQLYDKIVHQYILDVNRNKVFESYDHMDTIILSPAFPNSEAIFAKFAESDVYIIKSR